MMAGAAALLIVLSGCSKKPGGQVVAVVNGEEITQQELNAELENAHVPQGADQKQVMPALLRRVVDRKLVTQLAKKDGLDKTPAFQAQLRIVQENLLASQYASKIAKTITLPDSATVAAFIKDNPTIFGQRKRYTLEQLVFSPPADPAFVKKLQPAHSINAIAEVLTAAQIPFARGTGKLDSGAIPPEIAAKIAALPAGEPFLLPDNGRLVASVIQSAEPIAITPEQANSGAVNIIRQKSLQNTLSKKVEAARTSADISYAPGFAPPKPKSAPVAP
jgi:EpsD family peptidyl-prolyl cis-trans isomerase